jgi:hypothetical protein
MLLKFDVLPRMREHSDFESLPRTTEFLSEHLSSEQGAHN